MLLSLDYDETYTRDPEFWNQVIALAKSRGHTVMCVTMRFEREGEEVKRDLAHQVSAIHFTGRRGKYRYLAERGIFPSVWLDDSPLFIVQDARGCNDFPGN